MLLKVGKKKDTKQITKQKKKSTRLLKVKTKKCD